MNTTTVADTAPAATVTPTPSTEHDFADAGARFDAITAKNKPAEVEKPTEVKPAKVEKATEKPKESEALIEGDIPAELLGEAKPKTEQAATEKPEYEKIFDEEPPVNLSDKGKVNWNAHRKAGRLAIQDRDAALAEAAKMKAELETLRGQKTSEPNTDQVKQYKDQLAEMEALVERVKFESSPRFRAFVTREKQQLDAAKGYLEGTEVNPNVIELAATAKGSKRLQILKDAGADAEVIASVQPYLAAYDQIQADKTTAIDQQRQITEQEAAEQTRVTEQRRQKEKAEEESVFTRVLAEVSTKFAPLQKLEGAQYEKWNAQVDQLVTDAKEFFNGSVPLDKLAELAIMGSGARVVNQINGKLRDKVAALLAEVASLKAAQPSVNGNEPKKEAIKDDGVDAFEAAGKRFDRLREGQPA